jgi:hypothetical protein
MASPEEGKFCCPRCGGGLRTDYAAAAADLDSPGGQPGAAGVLSDPPVDDNWELDQQLKHLGRVLRSAEVDGRGSQLADRQEVTRLDPAHGGPAACHLPPAGRPAHDHQPNSPRSSSALAVLTWIGLSLGTTTFVCGGMLLGWSIVADRQELWTLGLPIALGGQIALLVGLLFQVERLWRDNRHAAAKLDDVDEQLHELKTATTLLGTSHSSPATAFYCHLSSGASPQLLLSDLKSQLDLLALKIAQGE